MVAQPKPRYLTPEQYLQAERQADRKNEYVNGYVHSMAGASKEHNRITFNLAVELGSQLKSQPCEGFTNDLRVRVPAYNRYYYPDLIVVCGELEFEDDVLDTLLNPTVLIEVLSESTESKDRGEKLMAYQTLPSLKSYVLIAQDQPQIEIYERRELGWLYTLTQGLQESVLLNSIGCSLQLVDLYARVEFS